MKIYDILANYITKGSRRTLKKVFLVIITALLMILIKKPFNFQDGILRLINKSLPIITEFSVGILLFVIALIGIMGIWREDL